MGKRDKRVAFVNPIAAARARGPAPTSGPTIKDYLGRNRMSLEEAEELIIKTSKHGGANSLSAWEEELNDKYKKELKKAREKKMTEVAAPSFKKKRKDKKKMKKHSKVHARSRSPSLSDSDHHKARSKKRKIKKGKRRKRKLHHHSSSATDSTASEKQSEDEESETSQHRKKKKLSRVQDTEDTITTPLSPEVSETNSLIAATGGEQWSVEIEKRKGLLPTPVISRVEEEDGEEREGGEKQDTGVVQRRVKSTKWTDKWDSRDSSKAEHT